MNHNAIRIKGRIANYRQDIAYYERQRVPGEVDRDETDKKIQRKLELIAQCEAELAEITKES